MPTDNDLIRSFTSASSAPIKLLRSLTAVVDGQIRPKHLQLFPTNRCNVRCAWCSCRNVDRDAEMPIDEIRAVLDYFAKLGTDAISVTGGGEPTLHPHFVDMCVHAAEVRKMQIGVVTNGIIWGKEAPNLPYVGDMSLLNNLITWVRVSVTDTESGEYDVNRLHRIATWLPNVDLSVSFTVTDRVSVRTAIEVARFAAQHGNVTHVRFVDDIINGSDRMDRIEAECAAHTCKGIYQRRSSYAPGARRCLISLLKPVVDPRGLVFPCCGVQYAAGGAAQHLDMDESFSMCHWRDYATHAAFDGSACKKCFYAPYNDALQVLTTQLKHERFL